MSLIKGIDITLYSKTATGTDAFGQKTYSTSAVTVSNVIVAPSTAEEINDTLEFYGKKAEYTLCIPKGDNHSWDNVDVEFFGKKYHTIGPAKEYIESNLPLSWNKQVRVERIE